MGNCIAANKKTTPVARSASYDAYKSKEQIICLKDMKAIKRIENIQDQYEVLDKIGEGKQ